MRALARHPAIGFGTLAVRAVIVGAGRDERLHLVAFVDVGDARVRIERLLLLVARADVGSDVAATAALRRWRALRRVDQFMVVMRPRVGGAVVTLSPRQEKRMARGRSSESKGPE